MHGMWHLCKDQMGIKQDDRYFVISDKVMKVKASTKLLSIMHRCNTKRRKASARVAVALYDIYVINS